jgi:MFS family permease
MYNVQVLFPESNTPKLLIIATIQALMFYAAFEKIFFQENGLSILQIAWITVIFSVFVVVLEVPSGALSDRWVRKHVLSLSVFSSMIAVVLFATGNSFAQFSLGAIFASFAAVLNSGTNTSILFDSLKEFGATKKFEKYLATRRILSGAGFATASLFGGWIANSYSIEVAMWWTLVALVPALLICFSLREPVFHKTTGELTYFKHINHTAKYLTSNVYFIQVIILSVVIMATHILIKDYSQLYYFAAGFSFLMIGILSFFEGIKEMVSNYLGALMPTKKNLPMIYGLLLLLMSGSLIVSAWQPNIIGVMGLFLASAVFFIIDVPLLGSFHKQLDSSIRATSESFLNLVTEGSKMILAIAFAAVANVYSISFAFGVLGVLVLLYSLYYWLFTLNIFASQPSSE